MAHTPGPWVVNNFEPTTYGADWVDGPDRRVIADCSHIVARGPHGYSLDVDPDEIAANAHLIAAAPDLLSACKMALVSLRERKSFIDMPERRGDTEFVREQLRAAVAKAEPTP